MIRVRIVVGIHDAKLSEKLQLDPDLTLEKAVTQTRQSETVRQQEPTIRGSDLDVPIGAINDRKKSFKPRNQYVGQKQPSSGPPSCTRCGRSPFHEFQYCPAKNIRATDVDTSRHIVKCTNPRGTCMQLLLNPTTSSLEW